MTLNQQRHFDLWVLCINVKFNLIFIFISLSFFYDYSPIEIMVVHWKYFRVQWTIENRAMAQGKISFDNCFYSIERDSSRFLLFVFRNRHSSENHVWTVFIDLFCFWMTDFSHDSQSRFEILDGFKHSLCRAANTKRTQYKNKSVMATIYLLWSIFVLLHEFQK